MQFFSQFLQRHSARRHAAAVLATKQKIASLESKLDFWSTKGSTDSGGLPRSICEKLCEWTGELAAERVKLEHLQAKKSNF